MKPFSVIVGNVGQVHEGSNYMQARKIYNLYVAKSQHDEERVAGEPVTLFHHNEIKAEYFGTRKQDC